MGQKPSGGGLAVRCGVRDSFPRMPRGWGKAARPVSVGGLSLPSYWTRLASFFRQLPRGLAADGNNCSSSGGFACYFRPLPTGATAAVLGAPRRPDGEARLKMSGFKRTTKRMGERRTRISLRTSGRHRPWMPSRKKRRRGAVCFMFSPKTSRRGADRDRARGRAPLPV